MSPCGLDSSTAEVMLCSPQCVLPGVTRCGYPVTDDVNFDHLVKVAIARFPLCS